MDEIKSILEELDLLMAGIEDLAVLIGSSEISAGSNCMCILAKYGRDKIDVLAEKVQNNE